LTFEERAYIQSHPSIKVIGYQKLLLYGLIIFLVISLLTFYPYSNPEKGEYRY